VINMSLIACAYIRVSTADQEEYSPDAQIRLLKDYAAKNNMIITDIYQDLGISGRTADKRPEFQKMIAEARSKEHPYDFILVWKFSRFARNQEESIVYKSLLKRNKVDVVSVSEPLPDGFIGELVERIFEWMDEYYSIRLSGEVKRGMTQKALAGGYNGIVPCGYLKEKGPDTVPYIDPYYGEMIRMVFHMYANEEYSMIEIASKINGLGYRTRRNHKWESRNIADMIQNPFYIGKIRWNYGENRARALSGETIIMDGKHEPLIDIELWKKANDRYAEKSAAKSHAKRATIYKHWLSGVLRCPTCGGTLAYQRGHDARRNKDYPYFVCWKSVKGMCTTRNSISVERAEHYVLDGLKQIVRNNSIEYLDPIPAYNPGTEAIEKQMDAIRTKLQRVKDAYLNGIDSLEEYKTNKTKLTAELDKLEEQYVAAPQAPEPVTIQQLQSVYDYIEEHDGQSDRSEALNSVIDHIVYDKTTDTMEFVFK
jgi:DNA invertase Pin-like site-specific DNA recombinase